MNKHIKYPKIHRLGKEETEGVLLGTVHIQEKIDGANASIWVSDGKVVCGSKNNKLTSDVSSLKEGDNMFNGFVEWCGSTKLVHTFFNEHPTLRLYGEWLVRHTISYDETAYKNFYLFDIMDENGEFLEYDEVINIAKEYGFLYPQDHGSFENPTEEMIEEFVGKTTLGTVGEGVVLKNPDFVNEFGDKCYAKVVSQKFKEDNGITFGGNNKHSDTYWEMYIVNKYMTLPRVKKIIDKIQPEIDKRLDLEHCPRIAGTAYHDMLTEEIWEIAKKAGSVNFYQLKRLSMKKAIQIYKDILLGDISVADKI